MFYDRIADIKTRSYCCWIHIEYQNVQNIEKWLRFEREEWSQSQQTLSSDRL